MYCYLYLADQSTVDVEKMAGKILST